MAEFNFSEKWSILKGVKKAQSVDFAGASGGATDPAPKKRPTARGRRLQALGFRGEGKGIDKKTGEEKGLKGRRCIIKSGPMAGGVDPDCVEYNPSLVGRAKLEEGSTPDVIHRNIDRLMHGKAGYGTPYLQEGKNGPLYNAKQAAAIAYKKAGLSGAGTGKASDKLTSKQHYIAKNLDAIHKTGFENQDAAHDAVSKAYDQQRLEMYGKGAGPNGKGEGRVLGARDIVHNALIKNPNATPEELLKILKKSGVGKNLHKEEIAHLINDKVFQTNVRNVGVKIGQFVRGFIQDQKNKGVENPVDPTPEQIMQAIQGQTGNLTPDEINALVQSKGAVSGLYNTMSANQRAMAAYKKQQEEAQAANKLQDPEEFLQNTPGLANAINNQLSTVLKNATMTGLTGDGDEYDISSYSPEQYEQVIQNIKQKLPNLEDWQIKDVLKESYGLRNPSGDKPAQPVNDPNAPKPFASSAPVRPDNYHNLPHKNKIGQMLRRSLGGLKHEGYTLPDGTVLKSHDAAAEHRARVLQQEAFQDKRRRLHAGTGYNHGRYTNAVTKNPDLANSPIVKPQPAPAPAPAPATPAPRRTRKAAQPAQAQPAQAQPRKRGGAQAANANPPTPAPAAQQPTPAPPTSAANPPAPAPAAQAATPTGARKAQAPAKAAPTGSGSKAPVSQEEHSARGKALADTLGKVRENKAVQAALKALGLGDFLNDLHAHLSSAPGGGGEGEAAAAPPKPARSRKSAAKPKTEEKPASTSTTGEKPKRKSRAKPKPSDDANTASASEHSFSPPYGWNYGEPNQVQGEDANRNLVNIPEGWNAKSVS